MDSGLTTGDVALMRGDNGFSGGDGMAFMWIFALLILAGGGGGFFGNNATNAASTADIQRAVDLNAIQQGQADISADIQRGIYEINGATKDAAYNNLGEIRDVQAASAAGFASVQSALSTGFANTQNSLTSLQAQMQNCCCTTQRAIDNVNYNLATQSAAIQATDTANTQKILDMLASNRMADMQNQINALQMQNAMAGVVRYPTTSAYCSGSNPFSSSCGCSNI